MNTRRHFPVSVFVLSLFVAGCGLSDGSDREAPRADPTFITTAFNAAEIESLTGQVVGIDRVNIDPRENEERLAIIVKFIGNGEFPEIYVGPQDFLEDGGIDLGVLDYVDVVVSRVAVPGLDFVAREITLGETRVVLRDQWGTPYWEEHGESARRTYGGTVRMISNSTEERSIDPRPSRNSGLSPPRN